MNPEQQTDAELVQSSLKNADNFAYLVERYESRLTRYIRRFTGLDTPSVEDILQEAFIKIYINLNDFNTSLSFSSWAYRIVHNEAINTIKKAKRKKTVPLETDEADVKNLIDILKSDSDLPEEFSRKERIKKIRDVLSMLSPKYQEILVLRYLEDMDYKTIGDVLMMPIGTVGTLVNRAKKQFKTIARKNNLIS
ncbi:hypothetical protein COY07_00170 [Candidatus Peregrinibacteria bacterium CG_4_10_14_0_2_um_filter_43_11]|nr:MAG: hypothetical protein COY07_00170 [Candidatus Peregrinibacteria bacterium CG_4_10_14_0_2_um_filter_43_11]